MSGWKNIPTNSSCDLVFGVNIVDAVGSLASLPISISISLSKLMSMSSGNNERYSHTKTLSILFHRRMAGSDKAVVSS